eukprot:TRINITY_DN3683_c0_g1_i1.p1 TRINITY_DN3683_c0_g1~~TRINITY_DN3683_c0_g1_i1.p1  ORF type:complete len:134 (-),score=2.10 TRINITY_DN3683_c0_g1_i1:300-701(-)
MSRYLEQKKEGHKLSCWTRNREQMLNQIVTDENSNILLMLFRKKYQLNEFLIFIDCENDACHVQVYKSWSYALFATFYVFSILHIHRWLNFLSIKKNVIMRLYKNSGSALQVWSCNFVQLVRQLGGIDCKIEQ